jgi:polyisoprenoid-binding protein YceI
MKAQSIGMHTIKVLGTFLLGTLALLSFIGCNGSASTAITSTPTAAASSTQNMSPASGQESASGSAPSEPAATTVTDSQYQEVKMEVSDSSVARYLVQEQLARLSVPNNAVGETTAMSGTIVFGQGGRVQPESSIITVDLRALQSDEERRDDYIRENSLESNAYPTAEFVVREMIGLPWPLPENGEETFQLVGDMTLLPMG